MFIYLSIWKGKAINLPISLGGDNYLGRDGHSSTHLFGRGVVIHLTIHPGENGHSSTKFFGMEWPSIYPSFWEGLVIHLRIFCLGWGCWWSFIYPFILEGIATHLPICFWRGWPITYPSIWAGIAIHLPIYLGRDCHSSTH